jgi:hypothetical protein
MHYHLTLNGKATKVVYPTWESAREAVHAAVQAVRVDPTGLSRVLSWSDDEALLYTATTGAVQIQIVACATRHRGASTPA